METARLRLRRLTFDDAAFMLELLNDPDFLRYIGDRGVRTEADARKYIQDGPMQSYARDGFGLYLVESRDDKMPMGICGLLKRESLDDVDVGFAFLPQFRSRGYGFEAAEAVLAEAAAWGHQRVLAITSPDNAASMRLLRKLGFKPDGIVRLPGETEPVNVFERTAVPAGERA